MSGPLKASPREVLSDDLIGDPAAQRWEWFTASGVFHVPDGVTEVWVYLLGSPSGEPIARLVPLRGSGKVTVTIADRGIAAVQWTEP